MKHNVRKLLALALAMLLPAFALAEGEPVAIEGGAGFDARSEGLEGGAAVELDMGDGMPEADLAGELALDLDDGLLEDSGEAPEAVAGNGKTANGSGTKDDPIIIRVWDELRDGLSEAGIKDGESAYNPTYYRLIGNLNYARSSGSPMVVGGNRNVVLDLSGCEIDREADDPVQDGYTIRIEGNLTAINDDSFTGSIVGGNNTGDGGSVVVAEGGVFTLRSGVVGASSATNGGGVYVARGGLFNLEGGMVCMGTAKKGGGVYVAEGGAFNLFSGVIGGDGEGYVDPMKNSGTGAGVYVAKGGAFNMADGEISYNEAQPGGKGGGVYAEGTFRLMGGRIVANKGSSRAGGVYVTGVFEMSGGSIADHKGSGKGAGVCVADGGAFTMSGGEISNNSARVSGGGVYVEKGSFNLSGAAEIRNNQAGDGASNFVLHELDNGIRIVGDLGNSTPIGVSFEADVPEGLVFTRGLRGHGTADNFASEQAGGYKVVLAPDGEAALSRRTELAPEDVVAPDCALLARMTVSGSGRTALRVRWDSVDGAEGYDVYFARCGREYRSTPKATATGCSVRVSGLKARTEYKAFVRAWRKANGKKVYLGDSPEVHAITGGYDAKYCNAKSVGLNREKLTLKAGRSATLKATVKGVKAGRKVLAHVRKVRWYSDNVNVATVSGDGVVKAVGEGRCTVWAVANNGVRAAVKVVVR